MCLGPALEAWWEVGMLFYSKNRIGLAMESGKARVRVRHPSRARHPPETVS